MASNDGARLAVFGLTYRQHDNRNMMHILREYNKLPQNPGSRADLFVTLTALARELSTDPSRVEAITNWLENGGNFPFPNAGAPSPEFGRLPVENERTVQPGFGHPARHPVAHPTVVNGRMVDGVTQAYSTHPTMGSNQAFNAGPGRRLDGTIIEPAPASRRNNPFMPPMYSRGPAGGPGRRLDGTMVEPEPPLFVPGGDFEDGLFVPEGNVPADGRRVPRRRMPGRRVHDEDDDTDSSEDDDVFSDEDEDMEGDAMDLDHLPLPPHPPRSRPAIVDPAEEAPVPEGWIECIICAVAKAPGKFALSHNITETCNHEDDGLICLRCLEQSIRVPVDEGLLNLLVCPMCPEKLSGQDVLKYASERVFARYQYLLMSLNPNMIFCLAPNCGSGQIHSDPTTNPTMTCSKCSFKTCVIHKLPWHEGMTCEEFDSDESQIERLEQDEATAKLLAKLASKICPTCKQGVDRTDGCDHLRCRCGGEWCFECLASWENILRIGPTAHASTCKNHPNKVNLRPDQLRANEAKILESVHGGHISQTLLKAREERNAKVREKMRPQVLEAAEKRAKEAAAEKARMEKENSEKAGPSAKKKVKLIAPWEEK